MVYVLFLLLPGEYKASEPLAVEKAKANEGGGVKRSAEDDIENDHDDDHSAQDADTNTETPKLSKNQQRKLKRRKLWEESKKDKRAQRKEKRHSRSERRRLEKEAEIALAAAEGREPVFAEPPSNSRRQQQQQKSGGAGTTKVPVAVILDCQFEQYMMEKEWVSLASQVTRCYSDNRGAARPVHMFVSSFGGRMRERYETVLRNQHRQWKDVHFVEGDFVEASREAQDLMKGPQGGTLVDPLVNSGGEGDCISLSEPEPSAKKKKKNAPVPEPEAEDVDKSIVYLTADSPYTLDRLEPNTCYVIGGIIDKNREKGLCYRVARQRNVRTAKLPIGEFMLMQSRHVLATNHVMEIMLRWLESGHWGTAFMKVIPTRKGGTLKENENTPEADRIKLEDAEEAAASPLEKEDNDQVATQGDEGAAVSPNAEEHDEPDAREPGDAVQVDGENAEEGLRKNSLGEQRWSAPPLEEAKAPGGDAIS
ncbi:tRNA-methyltransferase-domain-containing protein [Whalleya microplaca]|nr:tRNA-methyltransferase-domain-containing protein [Whalleya microplaca]